MRLLLKYASVAVMVFALFFAGCGGDSVCGELSSELIAAAEEIAFDLGDCTSDEDCGPVKPHNDCSVMNISLCPVVTNLSRADEFQERYRAVIRPHWLKACFAAHECFEYEGVCTNDKCEAARCSNRVGASDRRKRSAVEAHPNEGHAIDLVLLAKRGFADYPLGHG